MRATSAKRVYSNYDELTEEEATRRILIIVTSLLSHPFQYMIFTGTLISLDNNYSNTVPGSGSEIFNLFAKSIKKGDFSQARFLYVQFMEELLPKLVNKNSWLRYDDTLNWLKKIQNDSIFNHKQENYFQPELLFSCLWSNVKDTNERHYQLSVAIEGFLQVVSEILISSEENNYKKWIMVNIEFTKFLNSENIKDYQSLITRLVNQARQNPPSPETFMQASKEFFIHRLAQKKATAEKGGFYGVSPGSVNRNYNHHKNLLNKQLESTESTQKDDPSLDNLVARIQKAIGTNTKQDFIDCLKLTANQPPLTELVLRV